MNNYKLEITPEIFDTLNVDYKTLENSIIIPFNCNSKKFNMDTYVDIFRDIVEIDHENCIPVVLVEAKEGHQIYNYDECYNYYIGVIIPVNGISQLIKKNINDHVTNDEKKYIQKIIWNHRDVLPTIQKQVEEKLKEMVDDKKVLFSQSLEGNEYHGTFRSLDNSKISLVIIDDYKKGTSAIQIQNISIAS